MNNVKICRFFSEKFGQYIITFIADNCFGYFELSATVCQISVFFCAWFSKTSPALVIFDQIQYFKPPFSIYR